MGTLYYTVDLSDQELKKRLENQEIAFDERKSLTRNINSGDSSVTVDITELGTIKALYIKSSLPITATINGTAILVKDFLFTSLSLLNTLAISCSDETGAEVAVILWASA